ncbi:MAG: metallophosphoesterase [Polyangiaceae bacterium]|nr:metallophosphoesterase [Polyangiaceae bacterium]
MTLSFATLSWVGWFAVVLSAWWLRSRPYAIFRGVVIGLHNLMAISIYSRLPDLPALQYLFVYLHTMVFVQAVLLIWPRLMPFGYRLLVSLPASWFAASTLFTFPWAITNALGWSVPGAWVPYLIGMFGLAQSLRTRETEVHIRAGRFGEAVSKEDAEHSELRRIRVENKAPGSRPLRIVQITDPHLGPFMSVERLRHIAERAVARQPDLVLLTGDFLTMESQADPGLLAAALEPLLAMPGRVFACRGNHDLEAPGTVARALQHAGVELLIDEARVVETELGPVQILGIDFAFRGRKERMQVTCEAHPRVAGALRVVLLHDPGAFIHLPPGDADLVLSGHTHGGQVGLLSFGLPHTMVTLFSRVPDHGLWARGLDRLYVHRGTGHYGFPLRLGVPSEESVLCVHPPEAS